MNAGASSVGDGIVVGISVGKSTTGVSVFDPVQAVTTTRIKIVTDIRNEYFFIYIPLLPDEINNAENGLRMTENIVSIFIIDILQKIEMDKAGFLFGFPGSDPQIS